MLIPYENVRQESGPGRRQWFEDRGFDLVVWRAADDSVSGFQILYDTQDGQWALTWRRESGFNHSWIDEGTTAPLANLTPILQPDGPIPWDWLRREFAARSEGMEPELRELVLGRLEAKR